ncbi:MAG: hypothetical protein HY422_02825 [Candidatus Komeilibacteria bacterium]|nr:hypothetical protein [Candidatus Komeilibacteria bacterium]
MKKVLFALAILTLFAAAPAFAAPAELTDGFVCPVFNSDAVGMHNPNAVQIGGGDYTIIGPTLTVPVNATNQDGAGSPGGTHAGPGDGSYSPIWNT